MTATECEVHFVCPRCAGEQKRPVRIIARELWRLKRRPPRCNNCLCTMDMERVVHMVRAQEILR